MKISLVICGSRGDVQPMIALALGLKKSGHEVVLFAPPENEEWVKGYDCPFLPLGMGIRNNPDIANPVVQSFVKFIRQEMIIQIDQLPELIRGSDLILGTGLVFGVPTVAEYLNIPYRFLAFSPPAMLGTNNDPVVLKFFGWLAKKLTNSSYKKLINQKRTKLGLKPIKDVITNWVGINTIAATDAALVAIPESTLLKVNVTGYMHLKHRGGLNIELENFLGSGTPPVFIGFGSMPVNDPGNVSQIILEVAKTIKQRFIISKGWAGLKEIESNNSCFFVDDVPHELLFPRLACVIHHGGAGTTATAARAGIPQIIIPHMADQFDWRTQIVRLGLGPYTGNFKSLSVKSLSTAILNCLSDARYKKKAEEISIIINKTDGVAITLKTIEKELKKIKGSF